MHSAVLQNKKYIKFAQKNTVEVVSLSSLERGVEEGKERAATYKSKDSAGNEAEYLVEFPGLTVAEMLALAKSKARSYNDTGAIPHTAFVDPFTLEKISGIRGGVSAQAVIEHAEDARKQIWQQQGKPSFTRKELGQIDGAESAVKSSLARGKLGSALTALARIRKKAAKWPDEAKARIASISEVAVRHAEKVLEQIEALAAQKPKQAKAKLAGLVRKLEGTSLAERARNLLSKLKGAN